MIPMQNKQVTVTENNAANVSFSPLALGTVKAQSWLKNQLRLLADNLTGNFEQISPDCAVEGGNRSGWLGGSGEAWERGTYYVRGLVSLAYVLEDESLIRKAQKWIDWTLQSQTESGAFGPYADDPKNFDWWPLMPMLMALEEYCDATGDARVVPFLEKYFNYQKTALQSKPLSDWGAARGGDNIFAVWWLYEKNGDKSLLDLCRLIYRQTDPWQAAYDQEAWSRSYHIVNVEQSFKLFPLMYALTGEQVYLDTYYKGIENLYMISGRQDGMSNGDEHAPRGIASVYGSETCAVVERMLCDEIALYLLRDASIADHLENIAYNALPQQLLPDGRGQVYFTMQNQIMANLGSHGFTSDGGDRSVYGVPGGYPCCVHNYHMGWPLFVASMWMSTSDGGVAAGAYGPCTVTATVGNNTKLTVTETTNYPYEETVLLKIGADKTDTYPIYVRVPQWCENAVLRINSREIEGVGLTAGAYICLTAEWEDGDTIELTFPQKLQAVITENNSVSIRYGAVLFALEIEEKWSELSYNPLNWNLPQGYTSYNITPASDWNYALADFDFSDIEKNFTVTRNSISDNMRYVQSDAPIILTASAVKVKDWIGNSTTQTAGTVPVSPVAKERLSEKTYTVRLVPYAFSRLRLTMIPWTGSEQLLWKPESNGNALSFKNVVGVSDEGNHGSNTVCRYWLQMNYLTPEELTLDLYINGKACGSVKLEEGTHTLETDVSGWFTADRYNRIELRMPGGVLLPTGLDIGLTVGFAYAGERYEAEQANIFGTAYNAYDHVAGIDDAGSGIEFANVKVQSDGEYTLRVYFAAPLGKATHTVFLDGEKVGVITYGTQGQSLGWGQFSMQIYEDLTLRVSAGTHTLRIEKTADDVGFAELDSVDLFAAP